MPMGWKKNLVENSNAHHPSAKQCFILQKCVVSIQTLLAEVVIQKRGEAEFAASMKSARSEEFFCSSRKAAPLCT